MYCRKVQKYDRLAACGSSCGDQKLVFTVQNANIKMSGSLMVCINHGSVHKSISLRAHHYTVLDRAHFKDDITLFCGSLPTQYGGMDMSILKVRDGRNAESHLPQAKTRLSPCRKLTPCGRR